MATGVQLIDDEERLKITGQIDGAPWWIEYHRIPSHVRSHIQQKHTKRGDKTDWQAVTTDLAKTGIDDWGGFIDAKGKPEAYRPELAGRLPVDILEQLSEAFMGSVAGDAERNEDLNDTSGSK